MSTRQQEIAKQYKLAFDAFKALELIIQSLHEQTRKLEQDKAELQSRERLFSMGFYASLAAAVLAITTVLTKLPTAFLDRRLKKLEILEKRIAIRKLRRDAA